MTQTMTDDEIVTLAREGFFEPARACRQVPMTDEQTKYLCYLSLMPPADCEALWQEATGLRGEGEPIREARIVQTVAARFRRPTAPDVLFFLATLAENAGDVVLYLTYAQWEAKRRGLERLDRFTFCCIFGEGFWTADDRQRLWDGQKVPHYIPGMNDNLLDSPPVLAWLNADQGDMKGDMT